MNKARMTIRFDHDPPKGRNKDHAREEHDANQNVPAGQNPGSTTAIPSSTNMTQRQQIGLPIRTLRTNLRGAFSRIICASFRRSGRSGITGTWTIVTGDHRPIIGPGDGWLRKDGAWTMITAGRTSMSLMNIRIHTTTCTRSFPGSMMMRFPGE